MAATLFAAACTSAHPLPTPRLNLLGLEAQLQEPIQQHVSMFHSTPLWHNHLSCQSIAAIANIVSELPIIIAVMRCPMPASPAPFEMIEYLFSSNRHAPASLVPAETSADRASSPCLYS